MRAAHVVISGRVQGVGFRNAAQRQASLLGVAGWIRNAPDGSVEMHAEGSDEAVKMFLEWCRVGPGAAKVDEVRIEDAPAEGAMSFVRK